MDQFDEPAEIAFVEIEHQTGQEWVLVFRELVRQGRRRLDSALTNYILELLV